MFNKYFSMNPKLREIPERLKGLVGLAAQPYIQGIPRIFLPPAIGVTPPPTALPTRTPTRTPTPTPTPTNPSGVIATPTPSPTPTRTQLQRELQ